MAETVPMTPLDKNGEQVSWESHNLNGGIVYLPVGANQEDLASISGGNIELSDLKVIGKSSHHKAVSATVYDFGGGKALRVITSTGDAVYDGGQNGLSWLTANLTLQRALEYFSEVGGNKNNDLCGLPQVVRTPSYLGMLSFTGMDYYLMSNEAEGKHLAGSNVGILGLCYGTDALYSTYGDSADVFIDPLEGNYLADERELVILDAVPLLLIPDPTVDQLHYG